MTQRRGVRRRRSPSSINAAVPALQPPLKRAASTGARALQQLPNGAHASDSVAPHPRPSTEGDAAACVHDAVTSPPAVCAPETSEPGAVPAAPKAAGSPPPPLPAHVSYCLTVKARLFAKYKCARQGAVLWAPPRAYDLSSVAADAPRPPHPPGVLVLLANADFGAPVSLKGSEQRSVAGVVNRLVKGVDAADRRRR